ncbi:hypothetical protein ES702_02594 [subsurface metagenome]
MLTPSVAPSRTANDLNTRIHYTSYTTSFLERAVCKTCCRTDQCSHTNRESVLPIFSLFAIWILQAPLVNKADNRPCMLFVLTLRCFGQAILCWATTELFSVLRDLTPFLLQCFELYDETPYLADGIFPSTTAHFLHFKIRWSDLKEPILSSTLVPSSTRTLTIIE